MTPIFTSGKMKGMSRAILDCAVGLSDRIRKGIAAEGEVLELQELFGSFTLDVIASSVFDTKLPNLGDKEDPFQKYAKEMFASFGGYVIIIFFAFPSLSKHLQFLMPQAP